MGTIRKAACMTGFLFTMGALYTLIVFLLFKYVDEPFVLAGAVPVVTAWLIALIFVGINILRRIWKRMDMMNEDDEDFDQYGA